MRQFYFIFSLVLISSVSLAQDPDVIWDKTIGANGIERCRAISATSDGGVIVLGFSDSDASGSKSEDNIGLDDYWVVKLDNNGNLQWENTIGGSGSDKAESVIQTTDGGYIVAGYSSSPVSGDKTEDPYSGTEYWLVKLNSSGVVQWDANIGGTDIDYAHNLLATPDNGCLVGGRSESDASADKSENSIGSEDYWVVKLDEDGEIEWENTIGGTNADYLWDMDFTTDNGYILAGQSFSGIGGDKTEDRVGPIGFSDIWIVKINSNGIVQWDETIGGTDQDRVKEIKATSDGGYIIGAYSLSGASGDKSEPSVAWDYWIIKTDASGNIEWENTLSVNGDAFVYDLLEIGDQYLIAGYQNATSGIDLTDTPIGATDIWLVTLDSNGDKIADNLIGGSANESLFAVSQAADGSIYLGSESWSDVSGDKTEDAVGFSDYWIVKMDNFLNVEENTLDNKLIIAKNPVTDRLLLSGTVSLNNAEFAIYNVLGSKGINWSDRYR